MATETPDNLPTQATDTAKINISIATDGGTVSDSIIKIGDVTGGDKITVGDIKNSIGIAIGHGASSTVHIHASPESEAQKSPIDKILESYKNRTTNLNLNPTDIELFTYACELSLASDKPILSSEELKEKANELHLTNDDLYEMVEVLDGQSLIKLNGSMAGTFVFEITAKGFAFYANNHIHDFSDALACTLVLLRKSNLETEAQLAETLGKSSIFTEYLLRILEDLELYESPQTLWSNGALGKITANGKRLVVKLS